MNTSPHSTDRKALIDRLRLNALQARSAALATPAVETSVGDGWLRLSKTCDEAADEIDRLQARVRELEEKHRIASDEWDAALGQIAQLESALLAARRSGEGK